MMERDQWPSDILKRLDFRRFSLQRMAMGLVCLSLALPSLAWGQGKGSPQQISAEKVSADLLELYAKTHEAQEIAEFDEIVTGCAKALADSRRSATDRKYARDLLAWGANRRGEVYSDQAATAVTEGKLEQAQALDQKALADFSLSLQQDPGRWRSRHNLAITLAMQRRYDEAIDEFSQVLKQNPKHGNAFFNRGELYYLKKEYDLAIADFTVAAQLDPRDASTVSSRAHAKFMLEQYDASLKDYALAAQLEPQNLDYLVDLADAYQALSRWREATETYAQVIDQDANHVRALQNVAWLLATCPNEMYRDGEGAVDVANRLFELAAETQYRHWDILAAAQATKGDFAKALKSAAKALESAPTEERQEIKERLTLFRNQRIYLQPTHQSNQPTLAASRRGQPQARTASQAVGTGIRRP